MVFHINSRLLNSLGLLSAGVLLANPNLVNAQAGAPNANSLIAQNTSAPTAATPPGMPKSPKLPATPMSPSSPLPKVTDPMVKPMADDLKPQVAPEAAVRNTTIVDIAASNDSFKTLTAALNAAGLTEALSGEGPFTVFAPTDAAFAALPAGLLEELLKPENKPLLVKILTYHVVSGKVLAADLKPGPVSSLEGSTIAVKFSETAANPKLPAAKIDDPKTGVKAPGSPKVSPKVGDMATPNTTPAISPSPTMTIMVNQAQVKLADVSASNGVIHAIDQVILPPDVMQQLTKAAPAKPSSVKPTLKPMMPQPVVQPAMPQP